MEYDPTDAAIHQGLLPRHARSFVVLTDTHLVDPRASHAGEFGSRLKQNDRLATALSLAASSGVETVVHLGDLVQDYPDSATHLPLLQTAVTQVREVAQHVHLVSGNTDLGDKHDPSSPAVHADDATVGMFNDAAGPPWQSFALAGLRGITLCSSILNSGSASEEHQWAWLLDQLSTDMPTVLFWHHPLFLRDRDDPGAGNYDAIAEPARSRLLELIDTHDVWGVFTGHSHFWFRTHLTERAQGYGISSTSFTRPGFSELFSSAPPADRGRDDVDKLGFVIVRVHPEGLRVHQVRSGTTTRLRLTGHDASPILTATPKDCPDSVLGVVARHPLATHAEIPDVFPSVVRQPVRDDHPFLAVLELGATAVSVNVRDAADPRVTERLRLLHREGVHVTGRLVWTDVPDRQALRSLIGAVGNIEITLLEPTTLPHPVLDTIANLNVPVSINALHRRRATTAELPRWLPGVPGHLVETIARQLGNERPDVTLVIADDEPLEPPDWINVERLHTLSGTSPAELLHLADRFLHAAARGQRFWVDSLTQLDRTLTTNPGLLDRARNPQPAFHLLRILNTVCHAAPCDIRSPRPGTWTIHRDDIHAELGPDTQSRSVEPGRHVIDLALGMLGQGPATHGPCLTIQTVDRHGTP